MPLSIKVKYRNTFLPSSQYTRDQDMLPSLLEMCIHVYKAKISWFKQWQKYLQLIFESITGGALIFDEKDLELKAVNILILQNGLLQVSLVLCDRVKLFQQIQNIERVNVRLVMMMPFIQWTYDSELVEWSVHLMSGNFLNR